MTKFHINSKGVPAPCKAEKGNCPFGGETGTDNHFDTVEQAQEFIDKQNETKYGLLPNKTQYSRKAGPEDQEYLDNRKKFLFNESPSPTYIEKCRSCKRIEDPSFYEQQRDAETYHFDKERKGRASKLESSYIDEGSAGFFEVEHRIKGKNYIKQVIEVRSTGQLVVYDKKKGHKVTTFMAHRARIETMFILANEIPTQEFMNEIANNHSKDLKRQKIDRKIGVE